MPPPKKQLRILTTVAGRCILKNVVFFCILLDAYLISNETYKSLTEDQVFKTPF